MYLLVAYTRTSVYYTIKIIRARYSCIREIREKKKNIPPIYFYDANMRIVIYYQKNLICI